MDFNPPSQQNNQNNINLDAFNLGANTQEQENNDNHNDH